MQEGWAEVCALPVDYGGYECGGGGVGKDVVGVQVGVLEGGCGVGGVLGEDEWEDEDVVFED